MPSLQAMASMVWDNNLFSINKITDAIALSDGIGWSGVSNGTRLKLFESSKLSKAELEKVKTD